MFPSSHQVHIPSMNYGIPMSPFGQSMIMNPPSMPSPSFGFRQSYFNPMNYRPGRNFGMVPRISKPFVPSTPSPTPMENETPREVFFRILSASLKEANRIYSGKQTTWKNPFLYKTTLCDYYIPQGYCRFGVNCWYAHGEHEIRQLPDTKELPDPDFLFMYLSYLGLPAEVLKALIQEAYCHAKEIEKATPPARFGISRSCNNSPVDDSKFLRSKSIEFFSSFKSNGDWEHIRSLMNGLTMDFDKSLPKVSQSRDLAFDKSFRLFGDSYPLNRF